jgi:hypothetical protein
MSLLKQLSSQTGDRTEASNRRVVMQCLDDPSLLREITGGLHSQDVRLVADCAEVFAQVAEYHPEWVAPLAGELSVLLNHPHTRVRWEAMHALALVVDFTPLTIQTLLPKLTEILQNDQSVIVRDYATDAIAFYASTGTTAAEAAFPLLVDMLTLWNGKQAAHALHGMEHIADQLPEKRPELHLIAEEYSRADKPVVRKAAKALIKALASYPGNRL